MPVLDEKVKELAKDVTEDMTKKLDQSWRDPVLKAACSLVEGAWRVAIRPQHLVFKLIGFALLSSTTSLSCLCDLDVGYYQ